MHYLAVTLIVVGFVSLVILGLTAASDKRREKSAPAAPGEPAEPVEAEEPVFDPPPLAEESFPRRPETEPVREATALAEWEAAEPERLEGVLFFDRDRTVLQGPEIFQKAAHRYFPAFKREGPAALALAEGFEIICGNSRHTYRPEDLEQVVFHNKAVVFVLRDPGRPVPVFMTNEPGIVREHIRQNTTGISTAHA